MVTFLKETYWTGGKQKSINQINNIMDDFQLHLRLVFKVWTTREVPRYLLFCGGGIFSAKALALVDTFSL